ncbi:unnamed protein product [Lymnaea stagnalis]|uniref:C2H2-type domain-containing protein n=1 Tax=Lymnaea stagnalis TaxID=6523 RepID=A0AAV2I595_LYMST
MNKTNIKVCFHIPAEFSDEYISQLKDKLKKLNRGQLEILICILSREIYRLEKCQTSSTINNHKEKHLFYLEDVPFESAKEPVLENTTIPELSDQDFQNRDDSSSSSRETPLHGSLSQQSLRVIEDHRKGQLEVIDVASGQMVYSKSWHGNISSDTADVLDSLVEERDMSVDLSDEEDKFAPNKALSNEVKRLKNKKFKFDSEQPIRSKSEMSECRGSNSGERYNKNKAVVDDENMFCQVCNKDFYHKDNLKSHLKKNHNKKTVLCSYCGKLVLHFRLETHLEKVHEKPSYTCHICQKGFLKRECLEGHINKHSNTKPYICEHCGRKYAYSTSLYTHKRLCSKSAVPAHLLHPRSLEEKDTFCICEICGMKFEGTSGLKDHHSAKHGGKVQCCGFCGKKFQWRPSYNRHVKKCRERTELERARCRKLASMSTGKIFTCECGRQYPYRQSFQRHQKTCPQKQDMESFVMPSNAVSIAANNTAATVHPSPLGIPLPEFLNL